MLRRWLVSLFFAPLMRAARVLIYLGRFDAADRALRLAERVSRLAAVAVLLSLPALAQVTGLCGPGKNCSVSTLLATSRSTAASQICWNLPTGATLGSVAGVSNNVSTTGFFVGASCSSLSSPLYSVNSSTGVVQLGPTAGAYFGVANAGFGSGATGTGTAFASFPTCNAGTAGRLLFDSTSNVWRQCINGTGWRSLSMTSVINAFVPTVTGSAALRLVAAWRQETPGLATYIYARRVLTDTTYTTGNMTLSVSDGVTTVCSATSPCNTNSAAFVNTCTGTLAASTVYLINLDTSGCSGGTGVSGDLNISLSVVGGI